MNFSLLYTIIGFVLAAYSVIGNDSIQTLGTFLASNKERFQWYTLWFAASVAMSFTLTFGWYFYDGDISYERLTQIPFQEVQWYHAMAPMVLLLLTRVGIPVSTTFLVLSAFATTVVLEKMLVKSGLFTISCPVVPCKVRFVEETTCKVGTFLPQSWVLEKQRSGSTFSRTLGFQDSETQLCFKFQTLHTIT